MEGERGNGTLVADVEDDLIVDADAVVKPLNLGRQRRGVVGVGSHEQLAVGMVLQIMAIECRATGIGKQQRALVLAVDVAEVGGVGIDVSAVYGC